MDVTDLRAKLRETCGECYTCTEEDADEPTDEVLAAWMSGEENPWGEGLTPAWAGHLDRAWLQPPPVDPFGRVVRYGEVAGG